MMLGKVIEIKPVQPSNVYPPMAVTELGMVIEVKPLHLRKAPWPIEVTVLGMVVALQPAIKVLESESIMALQLPRES